MPGMSLCVCKGVGNQIRSTLTSQSDGMLDIAFLFSMHTSHDGTTHPSCSACCSCPHEPRGNRPGAFAGVPRLRHVSVVFFPRVRTPCGHGAQVIVEGREKQSDGGENNKDHNHNPKTTTKGPQAESPPSCSLSSVLGETGETKKSV